MELRKCKMDTEFIFDEPMMKIMGMTYIHPKAEYKEIWKYVRLDRHKEFNKEKRYLVSTFGRVYDTKNNRLMNQSSLPPKGNKYHEGYRQVSFTIDSKFTGYLVHRLVALAFLPIDKNRPFVNHIDGNPAHNWLWNLEWCTGSENMQHAIRTGLKVDKRGQERSNSVWTDDEIRFICELLEEGHKATYIYHFLGDINPSPKIQYERVRTLCKHIAHKTHWTHISKDYNIDYTPYNYSKEQSSIRKANIRKMVNK